MNTTETRQEALPRSSERLQPPLIAAHALAGEPDRAVEELHAALAGRKQAFVLFYCSSRFDPNALADAFRSRFPGTPVMGCTTAGEIGPAGYREGSLVGIGFSTSHFSVASARIDDLDGFGEVDARGIAGELMGRVGGPAEHCFSILLVDGLSGGEERVARHCQRGLGNVPLVGGSAGDDLRFMATRVFQGGDFRRGAVWAVVRTSLPFKVFRSTHFVAASEPLVVTEADSDRRIVREINGYPAAVEYARVVGIDPADLNPVRFAAAPLVVRIGAADFVRSIRCVGVDGSLSLYCAIERGVVLRVAQGMDLLGARRNLFGEIRRQVGEPLCTLGFDCVHCRLEAEKLDGKEAIAQLFAEHRVVGFSSYGEQFVGTHVNQTFTGVAIGRRSPP